MRKEKENTFSSRLRKKAAQGIGTLIIFIALILVAAVAAGVLIQTASSLQSKSLDVGRQTQQKITTDLEVIQAFVWNTSDGVIDAGTDNMTVVVRLGSGSSPVKLDDLLVRYDTPRGSQSLVYNTASNGSGNNFSTSEYDILYRIEGANNLVGYVSSGDLVEFTFTIGGTLNDNITESETTTLRLITKNGAVKPVFMTSPAAMVEYITYLYP